MSTLERYVTELGHALHGPRGAKRDLMCEARDHLVDATESLQSVGYRRRDAEAQAVESFGPVTEIAPGYQAVLSSGHSRRIALAMLAVVLVQPLAWGLWNAGPHGGDNDSALGMLNRIVDAVGIVGIAASVLIALGGGIGVRYLGVRSWIIRSSRLTTLFISTLIGSLAIAMTVSSGYKSWVGTAFTAVVVVIPLAVVGRSSLRCLHTLDGATDLARLDAGT